jgi:hypothetical protein
MKPENKHFLLLFAISSTYALLGALSIIAINRAHLFSSNEIFGSFVLSFFLPAFLFGLFFLLNNKTLDTWMHEVTGHTKPPPPPPKSPATQALGRFLTSLLVTLVFIGVILFEAIPRTTIFDASILCTSATITVVLLWLLLYIDIFAERYMGLFIGSGVSTLLFAPPANFDFPPLLILLVAIVPPLIGHGINCWINTLQFVKDMRQRKKLEAQQQPQSPSVTPKVQPSGMTDVAEAIARELGTK